MAIDSASKLSSTKWRTRAYMVPCSPRDVVEQCEFGRLPSRPVITEKDVKYEERALAGDNRWVRCEPLKTPRVGCNPCKHRWLVGP